MLKTEKSILCWLIVAQVMNSENLSYERGGKQ